MEATLPATEEGLEFPSATPAAAPAPLPPPPANGEQQQQRRPAPPTPSAAARLRRALLRHVRAVKALVGRLRRWLWQLVDFVLDEFEPWLKWVVLDAILTLAIASLVRRVEPLRPLFEAIGWA